MFAKTLLNGRLVALAATAVFAGCADRPAESGLVRRTDFSVSERWTTKPVMGRDFRPLLAPGMWACPGAYNVKKDACNGLCHRRGHLHAGYLSDSQ